MAQNGPKMVQKWPKSGQKWPKLPQNRRNKSRGSPRKSQRIPKISKKWPKTLPQCNMKMHQNSKNGPKSAKIGKNYEKNRFSLPQLLKKGHFLQEMHPKKCIRRRRKKSQIFFSPAALYRCDPRGGGAIEFLSSVLLRLYLGQNAILRRKSYKKNRPNNGPKMAQKWSKMAKIAPKSAK